MTAQHLEKLDRKEYNQTKKARYGEGLHPIYAAVGLVGLGARLVQGWILWGDGSRRLVYAPTKLDPGSASYFGTKILYGAPGAAFGLGHVVEWIATHPILLFTVALLITLAEFVTGIALVLGFATRLAASLALIINLLLMMAVGWLGATSVDEWTVASYGIATAALLFSSGSEVLSLDGFLIRRFPKIYEHKFLYFFCSGRLRLRVFKVLATSLGIGSLALCIFFYGYYRGAVYGEVDARTSPIHHRIYVNQAVLSTDGSLQLHSWINAGPDTQALYITGIDIKDEEGKVVERWSGTDLNRKTVSIQNRFKLSRVRFSAYGLQAPLASRAIIHIRRTQNLGISRGQSYSIVIHTIDGKTFHAPVAKVTTGAVSPPPNF